jgi:hypothetical protein
MPRKSRARDWLRTRAHEKRLHAFAERELARRLENGEQTVCEEMPVLREADGVPF